MQGEKIFGGHGLDIRGRSYMLITSGNKRVKGRRGTDYDTVNTCWGWNRG